MNYFKTILAISAFTLISSCGTHAHDAPKAEETTQYKDRVVSFRNENIQLMNPFARKAKKGQNSAAFVKVINTDLKTQQIVAATSPVANIIELHTSTEENGVHKMRPVEAIDVPAGGVVELKSGGYHVMLIDLKHDLIAGQEIPVTFEMDNGNKIETTYSVKGCGCGCKGDKKKK